MKVSVLMCVYNGEKFLPEALQSIFDQTYSDFELIIVDDASTDGSATLLDSYDDPRIVRISNPKNLGLPGARNRGIEAAKGEYIAILDQDDVAFPNRLELQISFLDEHQEVGVVGGQIEAIDENGDPISGYKADYPLSHSRIAWNLLFSSYFNNSSTMFRRAVWEDAGKYDESWYVDDFDLWIRMVWITRFANLAALINRYRSHSTSMIQHSAGRSKLLQEIPKVQKKFLKRLLDEDIRDEAVEAMFLSQFVHVKSITREQLDLAIDLILRCFDAMFEKNLFLIEEKLLLQQDLAEKIDIAYQRFYSDKISTSDLARYYWRSILPTPLIRLIQKLRLMVSKR